VALASMVGLELCTPPTGEKLRCISGKIASEVDCEVWGHIAPMTEKFGV